MFSYLQNTVWPVMNLVIRTKNARGELSAAVRREIEAVDSTQAIFICSATVGISFDSIAERRFNIFLLIAFAHRCARNRSVRHLRCDGVHSRTETHEIGIVFSGKERRYRCRPANVFVDPLNVGWQGHDRR